MRKRSKILLFLVLIMPFPLLGQIRDSIKMSYNRIDSRPQEAIVYIDDVHIGSTPVYFMWKDSVFPKQLRIVKEGFIDYNEVINNVGRLEKKITLVPLQGNKILSPVKEDKEPYFERPRKVFPIIVSSFAAVAGGVAAYYYKSLSIENRDKYDETGDPEALDKKKKYDLYSGISIILFQAGIGALLYFLLVD